jgi:hypothetical protein
VLFLLETAPHASLGRRPTQSCTSHDSPLITDLRVVGVVTADREKFAANICLMVSITHERPLNKLASMVPEGRRATNNQNEAVRRKSEKKQVITGDS